MKMIHVFYPSKLEELVEKGAKSGYIKYVLEKRNVASTDKATGKKIRSKQDVAILYPTRSIMEKEVFNKFSVDKSSSMVHSQLKYYGEVDLDSKGLADGAKVESINDYYFPVK